MDHFSTVKNKVIMKFFRQMNGTKKKSFWERVKTQKYRHSTYSYVLINGY